MKEESTYFYYYTSPERTYTLEGTTVFWNNKTEKTKNYNLENIKSNFKNGKWIKCNINGTPIKEISLILW